LVNPHMLPSLGQGQTGQMLGTYAIYQQTSTQVYVSSLSDVMLITGIMTCGAVVLACFLRHGRSTSAGGGPAMID
jgi:hypothetical protein